MRSKSAIPIPSEIVEQITSDLAEWRKAHRAPTPLPAEIWSRATTLASQYGARNTARTLGLGYASLLKRMGQDKSEAPRTATFMEWLPAVDVISECTVEVTTGHGQLRVGMQQISATAVASIIREFCK